VNTVKVINTPDLKWCNAHSVKAKQNRLLRDDFLERLDENGTHVVGFSMWHVNYAGTQGIRAQLFCKLADRDEPVECWLDFMPEEFIGLASVEVPDRAEV